MAPVTDRAGTFVNWEGRVRQFGKILHNPSSLPDLRVLAGIAEELGTGLGFRTPEQVWAEMTEVGPWDGERGTSVRWFRDGRCCSPPSTHRRTVGSCSPPGSS